MSDLENLTTESHHPESQFLDQMSAAEIVDLMNREDALVAGAVRTQKEQIARAIEAIAERLADRGRLFYIGAGTSGRFGVLDASECPPTFNTPPEMVVGIIAGGDFALRRSIEGAEDHPELAQEDLSKHGFTKQDVLVGIATSGRTPYVIGGLRYAKAQGATTIGLTCNKMNHLESWSDILICPVVGAEIISGSTRLKAGTATKMILNMLTTGAMVLLGKTYGNLMVDLRASNVKLTERAIRLVSKLTQEDRSTAQDNLDKCNGKVKVAVISRLLDVSPADARLLLKQAGGHLRKILNAPNESITDGK